MNRRSRRWSIVAAALVLAALAGASVWYAAGERRLGWLVAALVRARTGLGVTVAAASVDGSRLTLRDVGLAAGPIAVHAERVEVGGGWLALAAPSAGPLSVRVVGARVAVAEGRAPAPAALDRLRAALRGLLEWSGTLTFRMEGAEVRAGGGSWTMDVNADKDGAGLRLAVVLMPSDGAPALRISADAGTDDTRAIRAGIDVAGSPAALSGLWPAWAPVPDALTARLDLRLAADVAGNGRVVLGGPAGTPAVVEAVGRWAPDAGLDVARYTVQWGADVRGRGTAALAWRAGGPSARAEVEGVVAGSRLEGRVTWNDGRLVVDATLADVDPGRLGAHFGLTAPVAARAREVRARWDAAGERGRARIEASGVAAAARPDIALDVTIDAAVRGGRGAWPPTSVEVAEVTVARQARTLLRATAASRSADALWPVDVRGAVEDVAALAALSPVPVVAAGTVTVSGEVHGVPPAVNAALQARLAQAALPAGAGGVRLAGVSAAVPWGWGGRPPSPGTLGVARIDAGGVTVHDLTAAVQQQAGRLLISGVRYRHAGGHGTGWIEWVPGDRRPLRARLDAERVDLAEMVREGGLRLAHVTGTVRYTVVAQYAEDGLSGLARITGEGGGEVSVEAVERLLESAAVQADSTWLVRQTLENLRVFRYETLDGEVRWAGGAGYLDLTLRGRKRLGLFPAPVEAINVRHVPLALLARALGRSTTP
jgi:hypothetical protein